MSRKLGITRITPEEALYYGEHYFDYVRDALEFVNKHRSDATRSAYGRYLKEFFAFLKDKHFADVTIKDVQDWYEWQESKGRKPNTLKTKLACVRSFFGYLKYFDHVKTNPAESYAVEPPKVGDDIIGTALSPREVNILLTIPDRNKITGARDYALLLLMLRTFMRVAEAVSLRESDFAYQNDLWVARLKIKGGRYHTVPIPTDVKQAINHYHFLDRAQRQMIRPKAGESRFIFMPEMEKKTQVDFHANTHLTTRHVWHLVRNKYGHLLFLDENIRLKRENEKLGLADDYTIERKLSPHDLRKTAITRALDQGETYRRVMNAARLKSVETVRRYDNHRHRLEENSILSLNYNEEKSEGKI